MAVTTSIRTHFTWTAGPARVENGEIVMVIDVSQPATSPTLTDGVEVELARIHAPTDAVEFVTRFGLLEHGPYMAESIYGPEQPGTTPDFKIPAEEREPYALFESSANDLRTILYLMKNVRAAASGDKAAVRKLHEWERTARPDWTSAKKEDFLPAITSAVSVMLSEGMRGTAQSTRIEISGPVYPLDPREGADRLTLAVSVPTLRAFAYWSLAQKLIARDPIETCPECDHDFVVQYHGKQRKQKFCSRNCARRARYREVQQQQSGEKSSGRR